MIKWEIVYRADGYEQDLLDAGWEPYAVTDTSEALLYHFRRQIQSSEE